jgi:hypothetical protein
VTHDFSRSAPCTFSRIGAALAMRVENLYDERRRPWICFRDKGGKRHEMPCHDNLGNPHAEDIAPIIAWSIPTASAKPCVTCALSEKSPGAA